MNFSLRILPIIIVFLFQTSIAAQKKPSIDISIDSTKALFKVGKYQEAINHSKQAAWACVKDKECPNEKAAIAFTWTANALARLSQSDSCFYYAQQARSLLHKDSLNHQWPLANVYTTLGHYYGLIEDYNAAIDIFKQKLELKLDTTSREHLQNQSTAYSNLSILNSLKGDVEMALELILTSLKLEKKIYGEDNIKLATTFHNTAILYTSAKEYEKAHQYNRKAIELTLEHFGETHPYLVTIYSNAAINYRHQKDYEKAIQYIFKAEEVLLKTNGKQHPYYAKLNVDIGRIYEKMGQYELAIQYAEKASKTRVQQYNFKHPRIGNDYIWLSRLYLLNKEYDKAWQSLEKARDILNYDEAESKNFEAINELNYLFSYFEQRVIYYETLSTLENQTSYRDSILQSLDRLMLLWDNIEEKTNTKADKFLKIERAFPVFEKAISHRFQTRDRQKWEEAFIIAEKSKSRLLYQNFKTLQVASFYNVPDSIIKKENKIQKSITDFETKRFKEKFSSNPLKDSLISDLELKILQFNLEKESLTETIKNRHPEYYRLKHSSKDVDISIIQSTLDKDESIIEYFVGDSSIYIFVLGQTSFSVKEIKKDFPLDDWIKQFRQSIYGHWTNKEYSDELYQKNANIYTESAFQLYQKLIAPVKPFLTKRLIIIPDASLYLLPFDALLVNRPQQRNNDFKTHHYLIRDYQIAYNFSANFRTEATKNKPKDNDKNLIAFAPSFKPLSGTTTNIRSQLYELQYNQEETNVINSIIPSTVFLAEKASKERFMQLFDTSYKIVHLATHGKANNNSGDFSFLAFTQLDTSEEKSNLLYARELYNTSTKADMVVLSACETGIGELKKGEGMISLSRGFTYAGAQSVLSSLWTINDQQSVDFFKLFYQNIKEGMPKDKALRQAKLSYLEQSPLPDPYFWSAFVITGDMTAIDLNSSRSSWKWIGFAFALIVVFIFYKKIRG